MIPSCLISLFFKFVKRNKIILMSERFEKRDALVHDRLLKRVARAFFNVYLRFVYRRCDALIAYSSKAADYLRHVGVKDEKIFKSVQAVFDIQKSPHKEVQQTNKDIITILSIAYLEDRKGIDNLIIAFKTLSNANTKLVIAGDGEIRQKLEAMASGNENIVFAGYVDGVEKRDLYEAADIFVLPSHFETWGLVVNEAMHYGLPVIITNAMGSTDLIDGNGIIIPAGDTDALVQALKKLVESCEIRNKMGERSQEIIRSVDLNAVTVPFMSAISYVLEQDVCR
jgi:glycosyltransferase involved in cell wall biosynthesis